MADDITDKELKREIGKLLGKRFRSNRSRLRAIKKLFFQHMAWSTMPKRVPADERVDAWRKRVTDLGKVFSSEGLPDEYLWRVAMRGLSDREGSKTAMRLLLADSLGIDPYALTKGGGNV